MAPSLTINNTFGALFLGMVISSVLFGITNLQVYVYFNRFPNDSMFHKTSVAGLWIFDALILALTIHAVYYYTISNFADPLALIFMNWSMKLQVTLTSLLVPVLQSLYTWRVWKLRGSDRVVPVTLCIAVVGCLTSAIITIRETYEDYMFSDILRRISKDIVYSDFSISAGLDISISSVLCYYLYRSRSRFPRTRSVVHNIMYWIVATGMLTSTISLVILITFIMMPNNMIFLAIEILMAKLYVNSFLAMMNARGALRDTSHKQSPSVSRSTQRTVAVHVEEDRRVIHDFEMSPQSPFDKDVMDITKSDTIAVAL